MGGTADLAAAEPYVLGIAVAVYSLGEMVRVLRAARAELLLQVGSAVFGKAMTRALRRDPTVGPRTCLLWTMVFGVLGSALYVAADALGRAEATRAAAARSGARREARPMPPNIGSVPS